MTPIRYPGGKSKKSIQKCIFNVFPQNYNEFREPFVGGGGLYFSININKKRWINDLDKDLIEVYLALRDKPEVFIKKCLEIEPHRKEEELPPPIYNQRLRDKFYEFVENTRCDPALRYFFINRTVWAGRVNYDIKSRLYFSVPKGWNIIKTNKLQDAARILQDTKITSLSYQKVLNAPGKDVFCYCDPPYYVNTNLSKNSQLYKHNFTVGDHVDLSNTIKACPHKVCLSYDDDPFIRDLYKGFTIKEAEWTYSGTSSAKSDASKDNKKKKGRELLILNY